MKEVTSNLNEREKWQQQHLNLEVDDIVVIIDSYSPRVETNVHTVWFIYDFHSLLQYFCLFSLSVLCFLNVSYGRKSMLNQLCNKSQTSQIN
jgi:hypothetical protein